MAVLRGKSVEGASLVRIMGSEKFLRSAAKLFIRAQSGKDKAYKELLAEPVTAGKF